MPRREARRGEIGVLLALGPVRLASEPARVKNEPEAGYTIKDDPCVHERVASGVHAFGIPVEEVAQELLTDKPTKIEMGVSGNKCPASTHELEQANEGVEAGHAGLFSGLGMRPTRSVRLSASTHSSNS